MNNFLTTYHLTDLLVHSIWILASCYCRPRIYYNVLDPTSSCSEDSRRRKWRTATLLTQKETTSPAGRTLENGISFVGCSQFFSSYFAYGGLSIIWNVYANLVLGLVFRSDLCNTDPWMRTMSPEPARQIFVHAFDNVACSPGSQVSMMYLSCCAFDRSCTAFSSSGDTSGSNPVPLPDPSRTKRFVIGVVLCDPGRKERAPFDAVHFSSAIQQPRALGGSVYCE